MRPGVSEDVFSYTHSQLGKCQPKHAYYITFIKKRVTYLRLFQISATPTLYTKRKLQPDQRCVPVFYAIYNHQPTNQPKPVKPHNIQSQACQTLSKCTKAPHLPKPRLSNHAYPTTPTKLFLPNHAHSDTPAGSFST